MLITHYDVQRTETKRLLCTYVHKLSRTDKTGEVLITYEQSRTELTECLLCMCMKYFVQSIEAGSLLRMRMYIDNRVQNRQGAIRICMKNRVKSRLSAYSYVYT